MYWDSILSTYKPVAVNTTEIAVSKQDVEKPVNSIPVVEATEEKTKNAPTKTAAQIAKVNNYLLMKHHFILALINLN